MNKRIKKKKIKMEIKNMKLNDLLLLRFDLDDFDVDEIHSVLKCCEKIVPKENSILAIPKCIDFEYIDKEDAYNFLNHIKKEMDCFYKEKNNE